MTRSVPQPGKKQAAGLPVRSAGLSLIFFAVLPLLLGGWAVFVFTAGDPPALCAAGTVLALLFIGGALALGYAYAKGGQRDYFKVEIYFLSLGIVALLGSLLGFFVLNLENPLRLKTGTAAAVVFILAAAAYALWARLLPKIADDAGRLRIPRLAPIAENILLLAAAAMLFAMSFPGFVFSEGCGPLAFIALAPVAVVIGRAGWIEAAVYGGAYGFLAHALFNFWLATFNPVALTVVLSIRVVYYILLFLFLRLARELFPRWGFILQTFIWAGYEFLSAQGFIAYAYGIFGYSQYQFLPLLQTASLAGVWGLSLLVIFPGLYLGAAWRRGWREAIPFFKRTVLAPGVYAALFIAALVYGALAHIDTSRLPQLRVAGIQSNIDPWVGGDSAYEKSLGILMRLSSEAEKEAPDLVIWPETALVPSLRYQTAVRDDQDRYNRIIRPFLEFMDTRRSPYLIGTNDRELVGKDSEGLNITKSYNAALLLSGRTIEGVYRKTHLVPFTEHFPYRDLLPGIYDWLAGEDTHFYEAGGEADADKVFTVKGVPFSTLICFEDTFGEISRRFADRGARLFINLTNDAWSKSEAAETQHLAIAVFRAVENKRSLVRCTTSGITSVIDPNGRITSRLPPFEEASLVSDVPVSASVATPFMLAGDWCGLGAVIAALAGLAVGLVRRLAGKKRA